MNEPAAVQLRKNSVNERLDLEKVLATLHAAHVEYLKVDNGIHCIEALHTVLKQDGKLDLFRFQSVPGLSRFFRPASENECIAYGLPAGAIADVAMDEEGCVVTRYGVPDNV